MVTANNSIRPIIIIGCRRSGTTLLRSMLEEHPNLIVHPKEPQFILSLYRRYGYMLKDVPAALDKLLRHPYLPEDVSIDDLRRLNDQMTAMPLKQFIENYLHAWAGKELTVKRLVLKDPYFTFNLPLLHSLFPSAHYVHIVRDARANVSSQLARWPETTTWECALWWRDAVRAARAWDRNGQVPFTELRYEDLVLSPKETLKQLCAEIDIPYDDEMLSFEFKGRLFAPDAPPKPVRLTAVDPTRLNLWQQRLTPIQIRMIESCCHQEMAWWRYEPIVPKVLTMHLWVQMTYEKIYFAMLRLGRQIKHMVAFKK